MISLLVFLVGAWFVLGILGVALDFSNPVEDDLTYLPARILMAFFGPIWFAIMLAFVIFNPAPVRREEN